MLRWLSELTDDDNAAVGPKIARLGTLRASGINVPDGFAVTTAAFERFLAGNGLENSSTANWSVRPMSKILPRSRWPRTACGKSSNRRR